MAAFSVFSFAKPLQATEDPFAEVPKGVPAYSELQQLAQAGWLSGQDVAPADLTRFDVARLVEKAERHSGEIVVAQATSSPGDMLLPPPPEEGSTGTAAKTEAEAGPTTLTAAQKAQARAAAEKSLHNLEEAYQYELKMVKDQLKSIQDEAAQVDSDQYDLRKHLKGITQYPTLAIHGVGRAFGISQQFSGNDPSYVYDPSVPSGLFTAGVRSTLGYLDLNPVGQVSKEVRWNLILRLGSTFEPNDTPSFNLKRITMEFNPPWLSATVGDFDEAYTPLILWNRNTLDLRWTPEMWARQDDYYKYESFLNHEPNWPFRGLKLGESLMWPDSDLVQSLKASAFVDMIHEGFVDNGGFYVGPDQYTSWLIGGMAALKSPKWWAGSMPWQASLEFYGLILDEPLNSVQPTPGYNPNDLNSWAHQYLVGSVRPDVKAGLGDDVYVGATGEYAFSSYQDNKMDPNSVTSDFAFMGGPYLKFGNSSISVNYLYVDPYYYSPLAQTRQDAVTQLPEATSELSPWLFEAPLRSQFFLNGVPRASAIFGYYDRTVDNVFPYGMATPNRYGVGLDMDVQALNQNALKIKGSAYLVSEIQGNLVLSGGNYALVDAPTGSTRSFTYLNFGPSFNLAPYIGFERDLEVGVNFRYEETDSLLGSLTSTWIIGGVRADVLPAWEISAAFSERDANGTEESIGGNTLWARYPFLFDSTDAGSYQPFTVNGSVQSLGFTNSFKVNRNSSIYLDYVWTTGNMLPTNPNQGTVNNSFTEVTYEVQF